MAEPTLPGACREHARRRLRRPRVSQRRDPAVVYGPTLFNMGGADEYALVGELQPVARVHALASLNYLLPGKAKAAL